MLTGVVGAPAVLAAIDSSLPVDPLPDWAPVCEETDKGLERPEQGCVFMGWFTVTPSAAANFELGAWTWAFGCAALEAIDPFPANNIIAWAWKRCPNLSRSMTQDAVDNQLVVFVFCEFSVCVCVCVWERERGYLLRGYVIIDMHSTSIKDGQLSRRPRGLDTIPTGDIPI